MGAMSCLGGGLPSLSAFLVTIKIVPVSSIFSTHSNMVPSPLKNRMNVMHVNTHKLDGDVGINGQSWTKLICRK